MNTQISAWFSCSSLESASLLCVVCGQEVDLGKTADHHPRFCPKCRVESAFLNWKGRIVQIVPTIAPPVFAAFLRWGQQHLDELEYVEFVGAFEEIADSLNAVELHS